MIFSCCKCKIRVIMAIPYAAFIFANNDAETLNDANENDLMIYSTGGNLLIGIESNISIMNMNNSQLQINASNTYFPYEVTFSNGTISNANIDELNTNRIVTDAIYGCNAFFTNLSYSNVNYVDITMSTSTDSNVYITNITSSTLTSTTMSAVNANLTNITCQTLDSSILYGQSGFMVRGTFSNLFSSNSFLNNVSALNANLSNVFVPSKITFSNGIGSNLTILQTQGFNATYSNIVVNNIVPKFITSSNITTSNISTSYGTSFSAFASNLTVTNLASASNLFVKDTTTLSNTECAHFRVKTFYGLNCFTSNILTQSLVVNNWKGSNLFASNIFCVQGSFSNVLYSNLIIDNIDCGLGIFDNIGVGTLNPTYPLHITVANNDGISAYFESPIIVNSIMQVSDIRTKKNFSSIDISKAKDILRKLNVVSFDYIETRKKRKTGFIAQELETVFPECVSEIEEYVPNIYKNAFYSCIKNTLTFEEELESAIYDSPMKIFIGPDAYIITCTGSSIVNGQTVVYISEESKFLLKDCRVFVYGQIVRDFKVISYEPIVAMLVKCVQSLISSSD